MYRNIRPPGRMRGGFTSWRSEGKDVTANRPRTLMAGTLLRPPHAIIPPSAEHAFGNVHLPAIRGDPDARRGDRGAAREALATRRGTRLSRRGRADRAVGPGPARYHRGDRE